MIEKCLICSRISDIQNSKNPYFVKELNTGYVVLGDYQFYKGYTLFLSKTHVDELHKLKQERFEYLKEMSLVAEAVYNVFQPQKLNYELLGNTDKHLHWHIIPRYQNDPKPSSPIWIIDKKVRYADSAKLSIKESKIMKTELENEIDKLLEKNSFIKTII